MAKRKPAKRKKANGPIAKALKSEINNCESIYRLAIDTGIQQSVIRRFLYEEDQQRDLSLATADDLAMHFGLKLVRTKKR